MTRQDAIINAAMACVALAFLNYQDGLLIMSAVWLLFAIYHVTFLLGGDQ